MEAQENQQQQNDEQGGGAKASFLCRQSSTRWTPTSDQIRILKELYYNNGVRSPSAEQIQRISSRLRQYGKIEGKNVFYWFQNHKARERQKKRFTSDVSMQQRTVTYSPCNWKPEDYSNHGNKHPSFTTHGFSCASSASMFPMGQMGGFGCVAGPMERNFRDCSLSAATSGSYNGTINQNYGWAAMDPNYFPTAAYSSRFDLKQKYYNGTLKDEVEHEEEEEEEDEDEEEEEAPQIETLPLFPIHGEDLNVFCNIKNNPSCIYTNWLGKDNEHGSSNSNATSLELSLNTYNAQ